MTTQMEPLTATLSLDAAWCRCADRRRHAHHHDRLLLVETDFDELLELLELAVTWQELDYSDAAVVPPERWNDFAMTHVWRDQDRMERLFGLATDVALRAASGAVGGAQLLELVAR
ncbi:hypothetical protein [Pseudonocardia endophytica]|uniref:Uncharacterized protein n=1 Tax=Pseudonocardia endophytica TaxID=401976 RepID=A0A4R1HU38_PSEEN|nr:hypothetical protein [Pseudonocardia endophytica]TCK24445.1 hypothetical protein EV378_0217 [Pseudonocardia endophytica]